MVLGQIRLKDFLERTRGQVRGKLVTDAKDRHYAADYTWREEGDRLWVAPVSGAQHEVEMRPVIDLDESLVAFFGLYSGDGAKGSEGPNNLGRVRPPVSFCQKEPNLIRFAVEQFRRVFPGSVRFTFSLGEDSAFFMAGRGLQLLREHYGGVMPDLERLDHVRPKLSEADKRYLKEIRPVAGTSKEHLAFYFQHKEAMAAILAAVKRRELEAARIVLSEGDKVTASLRRPFKKGARTPGGTSRADEMSVGGVTGMGELFLKILHEIEASILDDSATSPQGLVVWNDTPSQVGQEVDVVEFFSTHPFGQLEGARPRFDEQRAVPGIIGRVGYVAGRWPRSTLRQVATNVRIDPLWCYAAGLYLAEGSTDKSVIFEMFRRKGSKPLALGFTSSENASLDLILRTLQKLFPAEDCVSAWKVKVGSQYFYELAVVGLKNAVPMLRGGNSGDGKLRTMEISLAVKQWALDVAPAMQPYEGKFSHVEPTGAGVPRIDFWASSSLCKWYFPLMVYAAFGGTINDPRVEFS